MKCSHVQPYFDRMYREADTFDRPDIAAHVRQCNRCSGDYAKWCGIARKLGDAPALEAPPALHGKVMRAIEAHPAGTRAWWVPLQWKLPPYGPAFAAVLLVAAISLFIAMPRICNRQTPVVSSGSDGVTAEVMVHFEITLANARQIAVVGDFNGWEVDKHLLTRTDTDTWKIDLPIPKGCYQYQFLVDGTQWRTDPCRAPNVPDGFGGFNTVIEL